MGMMVAYFAVFRKGDCGSGKRMVSFFQKAPERGFPEGENKMKRVASLLLGLWLLAGLVGCGGMTMLLSSSREIKISGNRSFVWFKMSLPFCGMGRNC